MANGTLNNHTCSGKTSVLPEKLIGVGRLRIKMLTLALFETRVSKINRSSNYKLDGLEMRNKNIVRYNKGCNFECIQVVFPHSWPEGWRKSCLMCVKLVLKSKHVEIVDLMEWA